MSGTAVVLKKYSMGLSGGSVGTVVIPAAGLIAILAFIAFWRPAAASYFGLNLILSYLVPLVFVVMAQLVIMAIGDIDLGVGSFVALAMCITAAFLDESVLLCVFALLLLICAYGLVGALISLRNLPSIIVTLGAGFVWYGVALTLFPVPGGSVPGWLSTLIRVSPPLVPLPVLVAVAVGAVSHWLMMKSAFGVSVRGFGGNPAGAGKLGWSAVRLRIAVYALAGLFATAGGVALAGMTTTGDANVGASYTLQSIAAVIIGGGQFSGGSVAPIGAVMGAAIMLLTGSLLTFADVSPNWQLAVQGAILIAVLSLRRILERP